MPMDVEFMYLDSMEALRPKNELYKSLDAAIVAVEQLFSAVSLNSESQWFRPTSYVRTNNAHQMGETTTTAEMTAKALNAERKWMTRRQKTTKR
jgi:hypothetical protein